MFCATTAEISFEFLTSIQQRDTNPTVEAITWHNLGSPIVHHNSSDSVWVDHGRIESRSKLTRPQNLPPSSNREDDLPSFEPCRFHGVLVAGGGRRLRAQLCPRRHMKMGNHPAFFQANYRFFVPGWVGLDQLVKYSVFYMKLK